MPNMNELISDADEIYAFLKTRGVDLMYSAGMQGLGIKRDGALVGGVMYTDYNKSNIWMHVAGTEGMQWISKSFLYAVFRYPFQQLGVKRATAWVEKSNTKSRRFVEHVGFKEDAVLKSAAQDGGDVIIYVMFREDCKYA